MKRKPNSAKAIKRSYGYVGSMVTFQAGGRDENTGMSSSPYSNPGAVVRTASVIEEPAQTISFVENWLEDFPDSWVDGPWGSGSIECDFYELPGRNVPPQGPGDRLPPACASYEQYSPAAATGAVETMRLPTVTLNSYAGGSSGTTTSICSSSRSRRKCSRRRGLLSIEA